MTANDFIQLDKIVKNGVDNNMSIYEIYIANKEKLNITVPTIYKYIRKGFLSVKRHDLAYAGKYKKRKRKKEYDYGNNKIDRPNHTYLDYLSVVINNPRIRVWQLDFLGSITTDNNMILSLIFPDIQFPIIHLMKNPKSIDVVNFLMK